MKWEIKTPKNLETALELSAKICRTKELPASRSNGKCWKIYHTVYWPIENSIHYESFIFWAEQISLESNICTKRMKQPRILWHFSLLFDSKNCKIVFAMCMCVCTHTYIQLYIYVSVSVYVTDYFIDMYLQNLCENVSNVCPPFFVHWIKSTTSIFTYAISKHLCVCWFCSVCFKYRNLSVKKRVWTTIN